MVSAINRHGENPPFELFMCRETANDNVPTSTTIEQIDNIIDNYANIISDDDEFVATQNDIDNNFVFPTPKRNHRQTLVPIVIVAVNTVNGVKLPRPLLCLLLRFDRLLVQ